MGETTSHPTARGATNSNRSRHWRLCGDGRSSAALRHLFGLNLAGLERFWCEWRKTEFEDEFEFDSGTRKIGGIEETALLLRTLSQKTDDFPSFAFRISCLWRQFLDEIKMPSEQAVELETGYREGRPAFLRRLTWIPRIEEKNCQQRSLGLQGPDNSTDIIWTLPWVDCTKTSMLKDPFKAACQLGGEIEKVRQLICLLPGKSKLASSVERAGRDIQTDDMRARTSLCDRPHIVSKAATRHQYASPHRASTKDPLHQWRRGRAFIPWYISGPVSLFPFHFSKFRRLLRPRAQRQCPPPVKKDWIRKPIPNRPTTKLASQNPRRLIRTAIAPTAMAIWNIVTLLASTSCVRR
jgi:hypothetical protein